jgi:hypothetical protein
MTDPKQRKPLTRGKRVIRALVTAAVIAIASIAVVNHEINVNPTVSIPIPTMPNPNAYDYIVAASAKATEAWPMPGLAPSYLHSVPIDPFTASSPPRYRSAGATYVLYSVGPDMHDDGGVPIFDKDRVSGKDRNSGYGWVEENSRGDIVAGLNFPR